MNSSTILTTLNVTCTTFDGPSNSTLQVELPRDTPIEALAPLIGPLVNPNFAAERFHVTLSSVILLNVTTKASTYGGVLQINIEEPLAKYYKDYRRHHGLAPTAKSSSESRFESAHTITVGPTQFTFNRTLRVPDDAKKYELPPSVGAFPLVNAQDYAATLPAHIQQRGGYIMPLFQREALWMRIRSPSGNCAIKVSVGGINAITGGKCDEKPPNSEQDYVVGGRQGWLDGFATAPGVVRQYVAIKPGRGYKIEELLSDTANGRIQIDVYPSLVGKFHHGQPQGRALALDKSPRQLDIKPGEQLRMTSAEFIKTLGDVVKHVTAAPVLDVLYRDSIQVIVKTLPGKIIPIAIEVGFDTVDDLRLKVQEKEDVPPDQQRLIFGGRELADGRTLSSYGIEHDSLVHFVLRIPGRGPIVAEDPDGGRMGIAVAGKIEQKIAQDTNLPLVYDDENPHRVFIHTVSTTAWELITGVVCPVTPIAWYYKFYEYPWFDLYNEHLRTVRPSGVFGAVRSLLKLDGPAPLRPYDNGDDIISPRTSPSCSHHAVCQAICIARPCGHASCPQCFGESAARAKCVVCKKRVDRYVGFEKPVSTAKAGSGSEGNWWEAEAQIGGAMSVNSTVVTLMLDEDAVSDLHGASESVRPPHE